VRLAVINVSHLAEMSEQVTQKQRKILFPSLAALLNVTEKTILEIGCGPG